MKFPRRMCSFVCYYGNSFYGSWVAIIGVSISTTICCNLFLIYVGIPLAWWMKNGAILIQNAHRRSYRLLLTIGYNLKSDQKWVYAMRDAIRFRIFVWPTIKMTYQLTRHHHHSRLSKERYWMQYIHVRIRSFCPNAIHNVDHNEWLKQ